MPTGGALSHYIASAARSTTSRQALSAIRDLRFAPDLCVLRRHDASMPLRSTPRSPNAPGAIRTRDLPLRRRLLGSTSAENEQDCIASETAPSVSASSCGTAIECDSELQQIVEAWPSIAKEVRAALLAIVIASKSRDTTTNAFPHRVETAAVSSLSPESS